ncbi:MAG: GGDEF domain-containing protein [Actinobacteria bacterium]|nr:GGDEF domain-containing protein [Actinomycetota bacterium]
MITSFLAMEAGVAIERSDLLHRLDELARTDKLTGLHNRRAFDELLERELARAARTGDPLALALLDLDRFKAYNDAHGHQGGDELLSLAASSWKQCLRDVDVLARWGGEEFVALLPNATPPDTVEVVVDRLRAATPLGQTCSAGVAVWDGSETAAELVRRADAALYEAKERGRDRTVVA